MIADIQKAIAAYQRLNTLGKRLFREEAGLKGPRDGVKRRRKAATKAPTTPTTPRLRATRRKADTTIEVPPSETVQ